MIFSWTFQNLIFQEGEAGGGGEEGKGGGRGRGGARTNTVGHN